MVTQVTFGIGGLVLNPTDIESVGPTLMTSVNSITTSHTGDLVKHYNSSGFLVNAYYGQQALSITIEAADSTGVYDALYQSNQEGNAVFARSSDSFLYGYTLAGAVVETALNAATDGDGEYGTYLFTPAAGGEDSKIVNITTGEASSTLLAKFQTQPTIQVIYVYGPPAMNGIDYNYKTRRGAPLHFNIMYHTSIIKENKTRLLILHAKDAVTSGGEMGMTALEVPSKSMTFDVIQNDLMVRDFSLI